MARKASVTKPEPTKRSGLLGVSAVCTNCAWSTESRNAAGVAYQHAKAYGHCVHVEQTTILIYNGD